MKINGFKILSGLIITGLIISASAAAFWLKGLPFLVSNKKVIGFVEKKVAQTMSVDLHIDSPVLVTKFSPDIDFSVKSLALAKGEQTLFNLEKFSLKVSLNDILKKVINVNEIGADNIFVDINALNDVFPSNTEQKTDDFDFFKHVNLLSSLIYINKSEVILNPVTGTTVDLKANNISLDNSRETKYFKFDIEADVSKKDKKVHISFSDDNKFILKDKHIYAKGCPFSLDKSKMFLNLTASKEEGWDAEVFAERFFIPDIIRLLQTDIAENNINEVLTFIDNINGDIDFNFKINQNGLSGFVKVNKCSGKIKALASLPFTLTKGIIAVGNRDIDLKDFEGYYADKKSDEVKFSGQAKNYTGDISVSVNMIAKVTNDFTEKYLAKVAGVKLTFTSPVNTLIEVKSKGNKVDVHAGGRVKAGEDMLIDGASISPVNWDRALGAVIHIVGDNINIENVNYYIAKQIMKGMKIEPLVTLTGNVRASDGFIKDMGLIIPKPLPSEFLNVIFGEKLLKGGKFSGEMNYLNTGAYPVIDGKMRAEGIRIPSQRLFLKSGEINTDNNLIHFVANGGYRRCKFKFDAHVLNKLLFPIVVKDTALTIDNTDIGNIIKSFSMPYVPPEKIDNKYVEKTQETAEAEPLEFDIGNIVIEHANVKILKGVYKEINFADVNADMSLDKNSVFKLESNRFEIAEGHSSAKINCDLKNKKYNILLGIKDVNSELISSSLLNLPREISGRSSGLINLNSDESLKLNGDVKFIIKDGTIQKIGMVEYVMKVASLFRNPFTMLSPAVFSDLVNIPDGNFDKITGELKLKDNMVSMMKIKSYSPSLSAFIVGRYNTENSDAALRIYTKFSNKKKGLAGILRNISLNTLANKIPLSARSDANYYAAELEMLPPIDADEKDCQVFLTKVDGDVEHNNFISSLKKIK